MQGFPDPFARCMACEEPFKPVMLRSINVWRPELFLMSEDEEPFDMLQCHEINAEERDQARGEKEASWGSGDLSCFLRYVSIRVCQSDSVPACVLRRQDQKDRAT